MRDGDPGNVLNPDIHVHPQIPYAPRPKTGAGHDLPQAHNGFQINNLILNRYRLFVSYPYIHKTCGMHVYYLAEYLPRIM
jgi:hypothetical protein